MRPAHMVAWISDIVNTQIVVILFSYLNVILTIARIGISHVVIVAEVVHIEQSCQTFQDILSTGDPLLGHEGGRNPAFCCKSRSHSLGQRAIMNALHVPGTLVIGNPESIGHFFFIETQDSVKKVEVFGFFNEDY